MKDRRPADTASVLERITGQRERRSAVARVSRELRLRTRRDARPGGRRSGGTADRSGGTADRSAGTRDATRRDQRRREVVPRASREERLDRPPVPRRGRRQAAARVDLALPALLAGALLLVVAHGVAATVGGIVLVYVSVVTLVASVFLLVGETEPRDRLGDPQSSPSEVALRGGSGASGKRRVA
jgi:hypothetical protein